MIWGNWFKAITDPIKRNVFRNPIPIESSDMDDMIQEMLDVRDELLYLQKTYGYGTSHPTSRADDRIDAMLSYQLPDPQDRMMPYCFVEMVLDPSIRGGSEINLFVSANTRMPEGRPISHYTGLTSENLGKIVRDVKHLIKFG